MIGTALRERTSRQMSRPLGHGIMLSRISRSKGTPLPSSSAASSPSAAGGTSNPSWASAYQTESRTHGSSSSMRMRPLLIASCHRGRARLGDREADPEGAPLPLHGLDPDPASHHVDHPLGDREAEAEALMRAGLAAPVEALGDAFELRSRNTGAGIDDLQDHFPLAVMTAANGNGAGRWSVLERVSEQADHHLAQQRRVSCRRQARLDVDDEIDVR